MEGTSDTYFDDLCRHVATVAVPYVMQFRPTPASRGSRRFYITSDILWHDACDPKADLYGDVSTVISLINDNEELTSKKVTLFHRGNPNWKSWIKPDHTALECCLVEG